jgi:cytochrome b561
MSATPATRYTAPAIVLHWLLALAIVGAFGMGWYLSGLPFSPAKVKLINWHKWAGITILALSLLRLGWRLGHPAPPLGARVLAGMPPWQRSAHHGVQWGLYGLFFVVPLLGWAYSSAAGVPVVWFGVWPLPDLMARDKELADLVLKPLHKTAAYTLAALVLLHTGAALKHHFVNRDGLLSRMGFGRANHLDGNPP